MNEAVLKARDRPIQHVLQPPWDLKIEPGKRVPEGGHIERRRHPSGGYPLICAPKIVRQPMLKGNAFIKA